ncbi:MAG: tagatose 1,6-diphosphate aldolase [Phototrophicaceae bacterium]
MMSISIGKYRALQRASTDEAFFTILAIDHLDSLRRALNPTAAEAVTDEEMIDFKQQVVQSMQAQISGVLLDPVYSAAQLLSHNLPKSVGLIVELEKADYNMQPLPLSVDIRPHWSVEKIKRMSADGVKLFYYYDPDNADLCAKQDAIIEAVVSACTAMDIPLYAEPIISDVTPANRARKVFQSASRASDLGADILKLEFPVDVSVETDHRVWEAACGNLSGLGKPWVLLSAGVAFDTYCEQVEVACRAGASGFMAGRAVWGDASAIGNPQERKAWLETIAVDRMQRLVSIAQDHARSWQEIYTPTPITPDWHIDY